MKTRCNKKLCMKKQFFLENNTGNGRGRAGRKNSSEKLREMARIARKLAIPWT